jgi:oligopeptide transport system permease protein
LTIPIEPVLRYALLRIIWAIPTLLLVIALAFLMVRAAPGGPFDAERALPPEIEQNIARAYHLDESLPQQFVRYVDGLLHGDLGPSYRYRGQNVSTLIGNALPVSMQLGALAMLLAIVAGMAAGISAALSQRKLVDRLVTGVAMAGISVPVFVVAPLMVLVFAVYLNWLPASWTGGTGVSRLVMPVVALALPQVAYIARLTRASMIGVLSSDFVRTARAQGLKTRSIVRYHALKPAMMPLLSYMGPAIAGILTGSVVVEQIFGIPGIGQFFIRGALNRDYTLVMGIVIFYAALVIVLNLIVDLLYAVLDPRIRRR